MIDIGDIGEHDDENNADQHRDILGACGGQVTLGRYCIRRV